MIIRWTLFLCLMLALFGQSKPLPGISSDQHETKPQESPQRRRLLAVEDNDDDDDGADDKDDEDDDDDDNEKNKSKHQAGIETDVDDPQSVFIPLEKLRAMVPGPGVKSRKMPIKPSDNENSAQDVKKKRRRSLGRKFLEYRDLDNDRIIVADQNPSVLPTSRVTRYASKSNGSSNIERKLHKEVKGDTGDGNVEYSDNNSYRGGESNNKDEDDDEEEEDDENSEDEYFDNDKDYDTSYRNENELNDNSNLHRNHEGAGESSSTFRQDLTRRNELDPKNISKFQKSSIKTSGSDVKMSQDISFPRYKKKSPKQISLNRPNHRVKRDSGVGSNRIDDKMMMEDEKSLLEKGRAEGKVDGEFSGHRRKEWLSKELKSIEMLMNATKKKLSKEEKTDDDKNLPAQLERDLQMINQDIHRQMKDPSSKRAFHKNDQHTSITRGNNDKDEIIRYERERDEERQSIRQNNEKRPGENYHSSPSNHRQAPGLHYKTGDYKPESRSETYRYQDTTDISRNENNNHNMDNRFRESGNEKSDHNNNNMVREGGRMSAGHQQYNSNHERERLRTSYPHNGPILGPSGEGRDSYEQKLHGDHDLIVSVRHRMRQGIPTSAGNSHGRQREIDREWQEGDRRRQTWRGHGRERHHRADELRERGHERGRYTPRQSNYERWDWENKDRKGGERNGDWETESRDEGNDNRRIRHGKRRYPDEQMRREIDEDHDTVVGDSYHDNGRHRFLEDEYSPDEEYDRRKVNKRLMLRGDRYNRRRFSTEDRSKRIPWFKRNKSRWENRLQAGRAWKGDANYKNDDDIDDDFYKEGVLSAHRDNMKEHTKTKQKVIVKKTINELQNNLKKLKVMFDAQDKLDGTYSEPPYDDFEGGDYANRKIQTLLVPDRTRFDTYDDFGAANIKRIDEDGDNDFDSLDFEDPDLSGHETDFKDMLHRRIKGYPVDNGEKKKKKKTRRKRRDVKDVKLNSIGVTKKKPNVDLIFLFRNHKSRFGKKRSLRPGVVKSNRPHRLRFRRDLITVNQTRHVSKEPVSIIEKELERRFNALMKILPKSEMEEKLDKKLHKEDNKQRDSNDVGKSIRAMQAGEKSDNDILSQTVNAQFILDGNRIRRKAPDYKSKRSKLEKRHTNIVSGENVTINIVQNEKTRMINDIDASPGETIDILDKHLLQQMDFNEGKQDFLNHKITKRGTNEWIQESRFNSEPKSSMLKTIARERARSKLTYRFDDDKRMKAMNEGIWDEGVNDEKSRDKSQDMVTSYETGFFPAAYRKLARLRDKLLWLDVMNRNNTEHQKFKIRFLNSMANKLLDDEKNGNPEQDFDAWIRMSTNNSPHRDSEILNDAVDDFNSNIESRVSQLTAYRRRKRRAAGKRYRKYRNKKKRIRVETVHENDYFDQDGLKLEPDDVYDYDDENESESDIRKENNRALKRHRYNDNNDYDKSEDADDDSEDDNDSDEIEVDDNGRHMKSYAPFAYTEKKKKAKRKELKPEDYSFWGAWSPCSVTCGVGQRFRSNMCAPDQPCTGKLAMTETEVCADRPECFFDRE